MKLVKHFLLLVLAGYLAGCGLSGVGRALNSAVLNQPDLETARTAMPAYLVMLDALIEEDPDDEDLLQSGALLYAFYGASLVDDPVRSKTLARKAREYGDRALCAENDHLCGLTHCSYDGLVRVLPGLADDEFPYLYAAAIGWLVHLQAHADDWTSLADLPKVEALLTRLLELAPSERRAVMHGYLGTLQTLRPPSLGGDPEKGRSHFEQALLLSGGRDLGIKVEYAARYARLVYDRNLHDRLLSEVLQADPREKDLTLTNILAQQRAKTLLASADDYF